MSPFDSLEETELQELVKSAQAGNRESLNTISNFIQDHVRKWTKSRCERDRNYFDHESIASEAIQRLVRSLQESMFDYRGKGKFLAYVNTTARNTYLDEIRRKEKEKEYIASLTDEDRERFEQAAGLLPSKHLRRKEFQSAVQAALEELRSDLRDVFRLCFFEELNYPQIGEALEFSEDHARYLYNRAIEQLRRKLNDFITSSLR